MKNLLDYLQNNPSVQLTVWWCPLKSQFRAGTVSSSNNKTHCYASTVEAAFAAMTEELGLAPDEQFATLHSTIGAFESANARLEKENKALRERISHLEGIIGKAIEMVNTPGTTFARLPEAINAKIMDRDRLIQNRINQIDALEKELSTLRGTYPVNEAATPAEMAAVEQASHALEDALRREAVANKIIELLVVAGHVPGERVGQARQLVEKL